jgi:RNA polymerase-binding protein DksA
MPISAQLHGEIERRLRKSREDVMASITPRISGDAREIAPATHIEQNEDRPQAEMISHNEEHFAERETTLLHEIDAALGKLAAGGYGICIECGREIPEQRLVATPTVQTCIQCQEMLEKENRTGAGPAI